jgi:hypothetical protein
LADEVRAHLGSTPGADANLVKDWVNNCTLRKLWNVKNTKADLGSVMDKRAVNAAEATEIDSWYQGALDIGKKLMLKMKRMVVGHAAKDAQDGEWTRLKDVARHGAVVLLNVTKKRTDALVLVNRKNKHGTLTYKGQCWLI